MDCDVSVLIYCSCLCFLNEFLSILIKPLLTLIIGFCKQSFDDLRNEVSSTRSKMNSLSMTDDYAKYIKLQRKLNIFRFELKQKVEKQMSQSIKIKYVVTYGVQAIVHIFYIVACWSNWGTTVIKLPIHWLTPIGSLLSWPTGIPGGVSVPAWLMISNLTAKLLSKSLIKQY